VDGKRLLFLWLEPVVEDLMRRLEAITKSTRTSDLCRSACDLFWRLPCTSILPPVVINDNLTVIDRFEQLTMLLRARLARRMCSAVA
jgi:hypothetical protein